MSFTRNLYYRRHGRTPVNFGDAWFGIPHADGSVQVSTVFLGIDHGYETMVFWDGHDLDQEQERYWTYCEAEDGHAAMVERVKTAWEAKKS